MEMEMRKKFLLVMLLGSIGLASSCGIPGLTIEKWPPNSISECEDFEEAGDQNFDHTRTDCYLYFFRESTDVDDCASVSDPALVKECIFSVAVNTNSIELCKQMDEQTYSDFCLQRVYSSLIEIARETNDPSICEQMEGSRSDDGPLTYDQRNECFYEVAVAHKRPELCSKIVGDTYGWVNEQNCLIDSE
jgi:hypothetical protein